MQVGAKCQGCQGSSTAHALPHHTASLRPDGTRPPLLEGTAHLLWLTGTFKGRGCVAGAAGLWSWHLTGPSRHPTGHHCPSWKLHWGHTWAMEPLSPGPTPRRHQASPGGAPAEGHLCGFSLAMGRPDPSCPAMTSYSGHKCRWLTTTSPQGTQSPELNLSPTHVPDFKPYPSVPAPAGHNLAGPDYSKRPVFHLDPTIFHLPARVSAFC